MRARSRVAATLLVLAAAVIVPAAPAFAVLPITVSLSSTVNTVDVGFTTTLTATSNTDVGPTPYFIEIFDLRTGVLQRDCGTGTVCSVPETQTTAGLHTYVAYVAPFSSSAPPAGVQAGSSPSYVVWSDFGLEVELTVPSQFGVQTVTAFTNANVGRTPYWIEIFNIGTGVRLAVCGSGVACPVVVGPGTTGVTLVGFASPNSTVFPPPGAVAASADLTLFPPQVQ